MIAQFKPFSGVIFAAVLLAGCQTATNDRQVSPEQVAPTTPASLTIQIDRPTNTNINRGYSDFVMDLASGRELASYHADDLRYPASLTKMMTLYLLFEDIQAGKISLSSEFTVSANAASRPPARLGLKAGETITARDAAQALAIKSANDVAVVVAENLSGSEAAFARRMNAKARALGLSKTHYVNASGLFDPRHVTTARDMAKLGRALKFGFPQYGSYYRAREFVYKGKHYKATNNLIGKVAGVDGLKTGYVSASGYQLVATARRGGKQRLVVVMGGSSEGARDRQVTELLEQSF